MSAERSEYTSFSQEERTGIVPCQFSYLDRPIAVTHDSAAFLLETTKETLPPEYLFGKTSDAFPLWERFTNATIDTYTKRILKAAQKTQDTELLMEGFSPLLLQKLPSVYNAIKTQAQKDAYEAIEKVKEKTRVVNMHRVTIPQAGISFQHYTLYGQKPEGMVENQWQIDEAITAALLFAKTKLGITLKPNLTFINIGLADYSLMEDSIKTTKKKLVYTNNLQQLLKTTGETFPKIDTALIYTSGHRKRKAKKTEGTWKFDKHVKKFVTKSDIRSARHETAHLVDPYTATATSGQAEGFARAFEYNFQFASLTRQLRKGHLYGRSVSLDNLESLFAIAHTKKNNPIAETYALSSTFFSYLYETCGAKVMMDWYGYVSGGKSFSLRGNLKQALATALKQHNAKESADDVIKSYLTAVNEGANPDTVGPIEAPAEEFLAA